MVKRRLCFALKWIIVRTAFPIYYLAPSVWIHLQSVEFLLRVGEAVLVLLDLIIKRWLLLLYC